MNNHSFVIRTLENWQDDAINCAGVASEDLDNGQFVTRGALGLTANGGYEFTCTLPTEKATDLWLVEKPAVGTTIEMQEMSDPRYFYNPKGSTFSIKGMTANRSFIEVPVSAFTTAPIDGTSKFASVNTKGRLVAVVEAPDAGTYFSIEATHTVDIGYEAVKTYILKCVRN